MADTFKNKRRKNKSSFVTTNTTRLGNRSGPKKYPVNMLAIQTGRGNSILRAKSEIIGALSEEHRVLIREMKRIVRDVKGLGLAAPQVGKNLRLFVLHVSLSWIHKIDGVKKHVSAPEVLINPEITFFSKEEVIMEEGCLSLPGIYYNVSRPKEIEVTYYDEHYNKQQLKDGGIVARVIQHEVDHLNGILFIDHV